LTFSHLNASDYTGVTKTVYETAYGISLDIYNTTSKAYRYGSYVNSSTARRSVAVTFTAFIPGGNGGIAAMANSAASAANSLTVNQFAASVTSANNALNTSAISPNASSTTISGATISGGATSSSSSSSSGDTNTAAIAGGIIGAIVFCCICGAFAWFLFKGSDSRLHQAGTSGKI